MYTISTLALIYCIINICHIASILAKHCTKTVSFAAIVHRILEIRSDVNRAVIVQVMVQILWIEHYIIGENLEGIIEWENDN